MIMIKRKQIAFNTDDPLQKELYDYVCKFKNFSFYGKNLIQKDLLNEWVSHKEEFVQEEEEKINFDANLFI